MTVQGFKGLPFFPSSHTLIQTQGASGKRLDANASHTVEARMCRWLLRIRDLTGSDEMNLTQEFLAQMLGVRRTSVSLVAGTPRRRPSSSIAGAEYGSWT
jgi:hypothetical protein